MNTLPSHVAYFFWGLFLGGLLAFVIIPSLIGYWRFLRSVKVGEKSRRQRLQECVGALVGMVVADIMGYMLCTSGANAMTRSTFSSLLLAVDSLFLLFVLDHLIMIGLERWKTRGNATNFVATHEAASSASDESVPLSS